MFLSEVVGRVELNRMTGRDQRENHDGVPPEIQKADKKQSGRSARSKKSAFLQLWVKNKLWGSAQPI